MSSLTEKRKAVIETMMKETIYKAAVKILLEHDLEGLTMDRVAEAAEMAKGTLYNYFRDKKSLQLYIFAKVSKPFNQKISIIRDDNISSKEKLEKIMEVIFHGFEENRKILNILAEGRIHNLKDYSMRLAKHPDYAESEVSKAPLEHVIESIILEGIQSGQFYGYDPKLATDIILGSVTSMIDRQIQNKQTSISDENFRQLIRFFTGGLTNISTNDTRS